MSRPIRAWATSLVIGISLGLMQCFGMLNSNIFTAAIFGLVLGNTLYGFFNSYIPMQCEPWKSIRVAFLVFCLTGFMTTGLFFLGHWIFGQFASVKNDLSYHIGIFDLGYSFFVLVGIMKFFLIAYLYKQCEKILRKNSKRPCPHCIGEKKLKVPFESLDFINQEIIRRCWACKGKMVVTEEDYHLIYAMDHFDSRYWTAGQWLIRGLIGTFVPYNESPYYRKPKTE